MQQPNEESSPNNPSPQEQPTKQQLAQIIKTFWEALIKPAWTKDDLIALGKAVFAKQALSSLDDELFRRLFPHLQEIGKVIAQLQTSVTATPKEKESA